jgi:hypothetical protein
VGLQVEVLGVRLGVREARAIEAEALQAVAEASVAMRSDSLVKEVALSSPPPFSCLLLFC